MQIPMRQSPKLTEPEKWSKEFSDFLEVSLDKDPKKRAKIATLLSHPFFAVCRRNFRYLQQRNPWTREYLST